MPFFKNHLSLNIYYEVINAEKNYLPLVVLIHGYGSSFSMFSKQITILKKKFKIILFDAIGHGKSDKPIEDLQENLIKNTLLDLEQMLNLLEIHSKLGIIGHSLFGCYVAQEFACKYSKKVSFLILLNGGSLKLDNTIRNIFWNLLPQFTRMHFQEIAQTSLSILIDRTLPFIQRAILPEEFEATEIEKKVLNEKIHSEILDMIEFEVNPSFFIKCPCLIIGAELDNFAPSYMSSEMQDKIADSELHIVSMTGHFGLIQRSLEYNKIILNFLKKNQIINSE